MKSFYFLISRSMIIRHSRIIGILKRLTDEKRLAHGYIFFGPEGVGKKLVAISLGNYCESGDFAPNTRALNDMHLTEPDEAGSIGIDAARAVKLFLYDRPNVSAYRLAIVNDAHWMTPEAQNALLKVAEEPPSSGVLILITSDDGGLLPTLQSRLHQFYFAPVSDLERRVSPEQSELVERADQFLKTPVTGRREFVKKLIAPPDFNLVVFLDACIKVLAQKKVQSTMDYALWHRLLSLRREAVRGSLNARLQLLALAADH